MQVHTLISSENGPIILWVMYPHRGDELEHTADSIRELVGEEQFAGFLQQTGPFQPVIASLVGLIPGCFSSVLLTELYLSGTLRFSSALAGLCSATGVGLVTLLRTSRSLRQTLLVLLLLWGIGAASGLLLGTLGI